MSTEASASASASERGPEAEAMRRALDLARRGWGRVAPNPLGRGVAAGHGLLDKEAAALNAPFLFAREQRMRPFVALKLATSIDGRIADLGGRSQWVSGPDARDYTHWLRAGFDAIAVGGTTALRDNPQLTVRGAIVPRKPPVRIVFDRRAMLNTGVTLVRTAREVPTWVVSSPQAPETSVALLERAGVRVSRPETLGAGLRQPREAGIHSVLCEGGGALGAQLLAEGLVDRLYWIQAPVWLGEGAVPAFPGVAAAPLPEAPRWTPVERRAMGPDTLLVLEDRKSVV